LASNLDFAGAVQKQILTNFWIDKIKLLEYH